VRDRASRLWSTSILLLAALVAACGAGGDGSPAPDDGVADDPIVVTLEVASDQTYRVLLEEPADIDVARRLLDGGDAPSIPNGRVVRDVVGVNEGYSWSIDPADFEWADVTIEVCDGLPSDVEAGLVTSDRYCPWSAVVVDLQPAP
jgi:hypothetical protein